MAVKRSTTWTGLHAWLVAEGDGVQVSAQLDGEWTPERIDDVVRMLGYARTLPTVFVVIAERNPLDADEEARHGE